MVNQWMLLVSYEYLWSFVTSFELCLCFFHISQDCTGAKVRQETWAVHAGMTTHSHTLFTEGSSDNFSIFENLAQKISLNLFSTCARPYKSYQVHQHFSVFPCFSIIRSLFYSFCTLFVFLQDSPALARMLTGWCSEQLEMYIDSEESPETKLQPLLLCNTFHGPWDMDTTLRDVFACFIYID